MENITQLVGYCKTTASTTHLFFRIGDSFHWCSTLSFMSRLSELRDKPGVKIFPQEPEIELYQAKTWDDAKKWFENP